MEGQTLSHFISIYEQFATSENKSNMTIESVVNAVTKFHNFLGGCADPKDIQAEDLRRYIRHLRQQSRWDGHPSIKQDHGSLSPHSIASYVRSIRSFWSWMESEKFINHNPFAEVKPPRVPLKEVTPLTPAEITELIKVIPRDNHQGYRDSSIILTLYGTALRISELLDLPVANVDFTSGQIKVMGKGGKERSVFMSPRVYKALLKYYQQWRPKIASGYFFVQGDGGKLSRFYFEHRMQIYVNRAGLTKRCTPHILRYSCAIQLLRNGCDPFTLQKILGHSTLDMTRRYVQIASSDVERGMKSYSPAEQLDVRL